MCKIFLELFFGGDYSSMNMGTIDISKLTLEEILDLKSQLSRIRVSASFDWDSLDWAKTNAELAAQHGIGAQSISVHRSLLGKPRVSKHSAAALSWDWTKSNTEIARENGVGVGVVTRYRAKLGKPPPPRAITSEVEILPSRHKFDVDWANLDWNRPDIEISKEIGCTRELIRRKRAELKIDKCLYHEMKYQRFLEAVNGSAEVGPEVAKRLGLSSASFARYCSKARIVRIRGKRQFQHEWHLMNWGLPNNILSDVWKLKPNSCASHRCNFHMPPPKFRSVKLRVPEEFQAEVQLEREKAEKYLAEM